MRKIIVCIFLTAAVSIVFAQNTPVGKPEDILKDGLSLAYYERDYLKTTEDFTAVNAASKAISKDDFFRLYATGNYLPLRLSGQGNRYMIVRISPEFSEGTRSSLQYYGRTGYERYKMEGKRIPGLNFTDINGKVYNSANTRGKILVLKCWFLSCQACNEEIPELNRLVDRYKNRKDVIFLSLAFDHKDKLKAFVKTHDFKYGLAHVNESYMEKQMGVREYPTHFLINGKGLIVKVVGTANDLTVALNKEAGI